MTIIITRLFDTYEHASAGVTAIEAMGVPHSAISLVANNMDERYTDQVGDGTNGAAPGAGTGASVGTVIGGGAGLLAGLGVLAIPGVGPVVAAGWLVATLVGSGVGAAGGGLIGSLIGSGVSETDAHVHAEGVRRGGTLVTVRADAEMAPEIERTLDAHNAVNTTERGDLWRSEGWSRFDEVAPAYRADVRSNTLL